MRSNVYRDLTFRVWCYQRADYGQSAEILHGHQNLDSGSIGRGNHLGIVQIGDLRGLCNYLDISLAVNLGAFCEGHEGYFGLASVACADPARR